MFRRRAAAAKRKAAPKPKPVAKPKSIADDWTEYHAGRTEGEFQAQIIERCHLLGHLVFHDPDARRCPHCHQMFFDRRVRGFPDLVIVKRPTLRRRAPWLLLVELKAQKGRLREEQKTWRLYLEAVAKLVPGFYYGVWRPADWPLIVSLLDDPEEGSLSA